MRAIFLSIAILCSSRVAEAATVMPTGRSVYCGARQWQKLIEDAANQFALAPSWLESILLAESAGCAYMNGVPTISSAGAMGLMQLIPETWQTLQAELHLGSDPFDPHDNITAGAKYLRELNDRFGLRGAIAAYHAGPGRYAQYIRTGEALPNSTLAYVSRVTAHINSALANASPFAPAESGLLVGSTTREAFIWRATLKPDQKTERRLSRRLFINLRHSGKTSKIVPPDTNDVSVSLDREDVHSDGMPSDSEAR